MPPTPGPTSPRKLSCLPEELDLSGVDEFLSTDQFLLEARDSARGETLGDEGVPWRLALRTMPTFWGLGIIF